jgi:DNA-binding Lrp family transcriptional regulator
VIDALDRRLIDALQEGLPLVERPFLELGRDLGLSEEGVIARIRCLLDTGVLSRFGPLFDAEKMGGTFVLAAMAVPEAEFDRVAGLVNAHPEVAHNYARDHALNMWFIVAAESPAAAAAVLAAIEVETGLAAIALPKEAEYFVGLRLAA